MGKSEKLFEKERVLLLLKFLILVLNYSRIQRNRNSKQKSMCEQYFREKTLKRVVLTCFQQIVPLFSTSCMHATCHMSDFEVLSTEYVQYVLEFDFQHFTCFHLTCTYAMRTVRLNGVADLRTQRDKCMTAGPVPYI